MEEYLVKEYGVISDSAYLKEENDIKDYFMDCGPDLMDCGQGYYEDEATALVEISGKFYEVSIEATIESSKQDRGDRLYFVDEIKAVTWKEIPKPSPKEKQLHTYTLLLTKEQKVAMDKYLKNFVS